jgi:hypothetical protein
MESSKRRQRWSVEKFAVVLSAQRSSGLSAQAYCRREGISFSSFYRWRDRVGSVRRGVRRAVVKQSCEEGEFIALPTLPMSSAMGAGLTLKFDLGGGMSLTVTR